MEFQKASVLLGIRNILPIMPSVVIFGLILGLTGAKTGLSLLITSSTSFIIFAGSAQFIVILLLSTGQPLLAIVIAGILINLRHLLYGAVLNPYIKAKRLKKVLLTYLLTDEAFLITKLTQNQEKEGIKEDIYNVDDILFGAGITLWSMWNAATIIGYLSFSIPIIKNNLTFSGEFIVASTFLGYFIMHWLNSPSSERLFVLMISIISVLLAFFLESSDLIIVLLIIGMVIAMFQKQFEIYKQSQNEVKIQ